MLPATRSRCRFDSGRTGVASPAPCQVVSHHRGFPPTALDSTHRVVVRRARRPLMPPTPLCIVARSMSRLSERARTSKLLGGVLLSSCIVLCSVAGCEQLDGRNRVKQGNRLFRETQFIDAAAEYQHALKSVEDPIIHYNLGLAYQKVVKS